MVDVPSSPAPAAARTGCRGSLILWPAALTGVRSNHTESWSGPGSATGAVLGTQASGSTSLPLTSQVNGPPDRAAASQTPVQYGLPVEVGSRSARAVTRWSGPARRWSRPAANCRARKAWARACAACWLFAATADSTRVSVMAPRSSATTSASSVSVSSSAKPPQAFDRVRARRAQRRPSCPLHGSFIYYGTRVEPTPCRTGFPRSMLRFHPAPEPPKNGVVISVGSARTILEVARFSRPVARKTRVRRPVPFWLQLCAPGNPA